MRRHLGFAAALLAFVLTGSTLAATTATVRIVPGVDGVTATYVFSEPVKAFAFEEAAAEVRDDTWHLASSDMTLQDGAVVRRDGAAFKTFTVRLTPDSQPRDRRYPALTRVGEGWQIYGPYFTGAEVKLTEASVKAPKGWTLAPAAGGGKVALAGHAYVGPKAYVTTGAATLVVAPNVEPWLRDKIVAAGIGATAFYSTRLDVPLETRPTLIVTRVPKFNPGWQGDTTDGPAASLRFFGPGPESPDAAARVVSFVDHEFFHFWNNRTFSSRDAEHEAWLHEGAAEYAALLAALDEGALDDKAVGAALATRLTGCASVLKLRALESDPPKQGKAVYDCGVLAEWSADLKIRAASEGRRDVLSAWRDVFAASKATQKQYDSGAFLAAAGMTDAAGDPLRLLMKPGADDRWTRLTAALSTLGARIEPTRSVEAERTALIWAFLGKACKGSYGFFGGDPKAIKLDTGDRCGALSGDLRIDGIAGQAIMTDAPKAYDAALALCAAGEGVPFTLEGKLVATAACPKTLPPPPLAWAVERWR